jgi:hypothetical protein
VAEILGLIIDEPWNAGEDLAASQAWLKEVEELDRQGFDVEYYLARARSLVAQAEDAPQLLPASAGG